MDDITDVEQLAELESLLYSQIHYSAITLEQEQTAAESLSPDLSSESNQNNVENTPSTYSKPRYFGRSIPTPTMQQQIARTLTLSENSRDLKATSSGLNPTLTVPQVNIHQPIHFKIPPIQPTTNNYVFLAPSLTLSRNQRRKLRKQERKSHEMTIQQAVNDAETFRHLNPDDRARVIKMQKRQRYLTRRKEKQKLLKEQELIRKFNDNIKNTSEEKNIIRYTTYPSKEIAVPLIKPMEVIELSETDEDEVVALDEPYEIVSLSSDEEIGYNKSRVDTSADTGVTLPGTTNDGDDSLIQLLEVTAPAIINIDVDSEAVKDEDVIKPPLEHEIISLSSNASGKSSDISGSQDHLSPPTPMCSTRHVANRHSDLVNTPESSNDFLDTTLDVMQQNFNFSLHGNDLCTAKSLLKPQTLADTYESESSTSDISSMKNPVFNELEFDSPSKQLFTEADLGLFSDFITPKRKLGLSAVTTSTAETENKNLPSTSTDAEARNISDSDSSSESELDEANASAVSLGAGSKRKRLPSLSHFDVDDSSAQSTPVLAKVTPKKRVKKKQIKMQNKFDFIKDAGVENMGEQVSIPSPKKFQKKRKNVNDKGLEVQDLRQDLELGDTEDAVQDASRNRQKNKLEDTDKNKSQATNLQNDNNGNNENTSDINVSFGKKRRRSKSKSDTEVEKFSKSPSKAVKQKIATKSDSEVDDSDNITKATDTGGQNVNNDKSSHGTGRINSNNNLVESPTKRRKGKMKSDTKADDEPVLITTTENQTDKEIQETNRVHKERTINESENFNNNDLWDVQIIEEPFECIDVSSAGDDGDEAIFGCEELKDLKTELELSNVVDMIPSVLTVHTPEESDFIHENEGVVEESKSWCSSGFNMRKVLLKMSDDPRKWRIMERDRIHIAIDSERGIRCKKCREFGHRADRCVRNILRCWLCGEQGHQEPRCPNTVCTNCGRYTRFFTSNCGRCKDVKNNKCNYCGVIGHLNDLCPDVWRRYHLTTEAGKIIAHMNYVGNKAFKSVDKRWCSGCAKSGHFEHTCNYYNRTHQRISPCVYEYEDLYKKQQTLQTTTTTEHSKVLKSSNGCAKKTPELINNTGSKSNTNNEFHKQVEMCHALTSEAKQMLETAAGKSFLTALFRDLNITYDITVKTDNIVLKLYGYPTDLVIVSSPIRHFVSNTTMSSRITTYSKHDFSILQSHIEWLKQNEEKFEVVIELGPKPKQLRFIGNVFAILLAEHKLNRSLSEMKSNEIEERFTLLPDALCTVRGHPKMKVYAQKYNIRWSLEQSILILKGNSENILSFRKMCGSFKNKPGKGSYPLLRIANNILKYAEYAPEKVTNQLLNTLLKNREYYALNAILLSKSKELKLIRSLKNLLETRLFLGPRSFGRAHRGLDVFKIERNTNTYFKCVMPAKSELTDINAIDTSDLYNVDDLLNANKKILLFELTQREMQHLIETEEGKDFLNELKYTYNAELRQGDSNLHFACNENNYKKVADYVRFYFLCLNMPFPSSAPNILDFLVKRLATAKLNYYTTSCCLLYQTMHCAENAWQVEQIHGLLFAHYELLDGLKHKETIMRYLKMLPHMKVNPVKLIRDYRRLKMSALYLFCPVLMDIDYKTLISIAVPPTIYSIPLSQINNTYAQVRSRIRYGYETLGRAKNSLGLAELNVLCDYLRKNEYSNESLEVASTFLNENCFEQKC